ncbi:hypothetical protein TNIN_404881 [Trichonephila inaurata madagascariensis]|uniref:Uncharacterized protein n=1 Tax=Trichonephila inaurata madagascariensis TaxID=2747483 RepID=A0A8X6XS21_9ARAC|nr:hypothetical protein TNIN_404881 [Trichonephila inaurata madagascariensis]
MLDGLPRNRYVLQTPHRIPYSRGTIQVEKYRFYPLARRCSLSNTLARPGALTRTTKASDASRMCVGHSDTHLNSLYGTKKGCKPLSESVREDSNA